jgi:hypothetical protein
LADVLTTDVSGSKEATCADTTCPLSAALPEQCNCYVRSQVHTRSKGDDMEMRSEDAEDERDEIPFTRTGCGIMLAVSLVTWSCVALAVIAIVAHLKGG